ncbi:hypothetical protein [Fimbriiglobus ruber]|uniref:Uncharacterized protein n=1 Tax=Fimbriiglobus ruber TaxID=1908690 RepID=A0A225E496_9BACT|nr:hypothetical protein [Fimbriiglobus ruber]OWK44309.1 hypothetical protein FRUB_02241 [Fimbriiglobus ruber]
MSLRKWFATAVTVTGGTLIAAGPAWAVEPLPPAAAAPRTALAFGVLTSMPAEVAKARSEAWLKVSNKFDAARFESVWSDAGRSVLDRVADSIAIGLPAAASSLDVARKSDTAPTEVPALLKDTALDPFVRANLAAVYAKSLAGRRVYEEALEAIKGVAPEQLVDPAGFYFYKAVAEHALIQREAAVLSLARLLDDVSDLPDRYRVVATLMFLDIQNWPRDDKDLSNITKLMDNSGRRLDLARGGQKTQDIQKKIVFRLDEKIKELENQSKNKSGQSANGGACPNGGQPGPGGANPSSPMETANIATNGGPGAVDEKKLRSYQEVWGKLPEAERKKVISEIVRDYPPKFKPMIEDYFRSLNRMNGFKP